MSTRAPERIKLHVAAWAVGGVALTFVEAIARLGHRGWGAVETGLTGPQWLALVGATLVLGYFEGYRALHLRFAPDVVAHALELAAGPRTARSLLAPLYATSLLGAERGVIVRAWLAVAAIASSVVVVRGLPDPWRGIVDLAVASALAWGLVALLARFFGAVRFGAAAASPKRVISELRS